MVLDPPWPLGRGRGGGRSGRARDRETSEQVSEPPACVTSGMLLNLSVPPFSHLENS